jgi:acetyl esterase/lipase
MVVKDSFPEPQGSRDLVAPELLTGLDLFPKFQFSAETLPLIRGGGGGREKMTRPPLSPTQAAVSCEQRFIPGAKDSPDVRVLIYTPPDKSTSPRPAYLHMHGGGYVLGTPEINDASNRSFAAELNCIVVSVDYRLAPETRYPGSLEDCYAALAWLQTQANTLNVDRTRIAIGGESAGGGHAAALALLARQRGEYSICFQLLDAPMIDDRTGSEADANPHPYCGEFIWPPVNNRFGWRALLGVEPGSDAVPIGAAPSRAADVSGLPPTFIAVGALDLFLEEDMEYARRLIRAGVPTELHVIPGAYHGFGVAGGDTPQVRINQQLRSAALARAFFA